MLRLFVDLRAIGLLQDTAQGPVDHLPEEEGLRTGNLGATSLHVSVTIVPRHIDNRLAKIKGTRHIWCPLFLEAVTKIRTEEHAVERLAVLKMLKNFFRFSRKYSHLRQVVDGLSGPFRLLDKSAVHVNGPSQLFQDLVVSEFVVGSPVPVSDLVHSPLHAWLTDHFQDASPRDGIFRCHALLRIREHLQRLQIDTAEAGKALKDLAYGILV